MTERDLQQENGASSTLILSIHLNISESNECIHSYLFQNTHIDYHAEVLHLVLLHSIKFIFKAFFIQTREM